MLTLICFYAWWFNWVSKIPHRKICTSITTWVHIHKNLSTINVIQWHENNIKLLLSWSSTPSPIFPPEKAVLAIIPQSKCIYLLVERSDLTCFDGMVESRKRFLHCINLAGVHTLLYFFELKDICSSLPNAFLASRLNHEWLYWTWSHCKKKYTLSLLTKTFLPYCDTTGVQKGFDGTSTFLSRNTAVCSTIWLRISNLKRIRLHTSFSTPDAVVSSIWRICDKHIRLLKHVDPKLHFWTPEKRSNVSLISHHSVLLSIFLLTTCKKEFFRDLKINNGWHILIFF